MQTNGDEVGSLVANGARAMAFAALRVGADDAAVDAAIAQVWQNRDDRYSEIRTAETAARQKIEMSYIGG